MDRRGRRTAAAALLAALHLALMLALAAVALRDPPNDSRGLPTDKHASRASDREPNVKKAGFAFGLRGGTGARYRHRVQWCKTPRLLPEPRAPLVALASFPGSGNTWLRYLLQQATGVLTGSVYKDYALMKNGFPAESVVNGSVLMVKSHEWGPRAREPFGATLLLIRSPKDSIQAEFNRQSGGHIGFAAPDKYKRVWKHFIGVKIRDWRRFHLDWLENFGGRLRVLRYEDLVQDVERSIRSVLRFVGQPVDEALLRCAIDRKEGIYRRRKRPLNFNPFTRPMEEAVSGVEVEVFTAVERLRHKQTSTNE